MRCGERGLERQSTVSKNMGVKGLLTDEQAFKKCEHCENAAKEKAQEEEEFVKQGTAFHKIKGVCKYHGKD